ncbi:TetR/AcrR family transcriptional regulator [Bradyrhizobium jicamae]|uniref:TetR/AcrR family transcriptional regulator n=1 Tax=Bradyrhizobium jicamae TaxID=280332 RepID=UPI001BAA412D|nr:TetR/AcrR family transcriptional regulator [Bradyrhizobium jicamae]MBR0754416.1 TetR/AcrR family transcriptional regulator [Bradyrhizobium jicamae]
MANLIAARRSSRRKSEVTRARLLEAARIVFSRDHFQNARITDICSEAGKAVGVFYRYFSDKQEIFFACVDEFFSDLLADSPKAAEFEKDASAAIRASTELYWSKYQQYYGVVASLFEIGMINPEIAALWRQVRENGIKRFAFRIRKQQALGKCATLDAEIAASALMSMLEFSCYNWNSQRLDFPERSIPDQAAIENLFVLIRNALEL